MQRLVGEQTIWIVSEGSPGHVSQSRGLADALCSSVSAQIHQVEVRQRGPGALRGFFRNLFKYAPGFRAFWVKLCTRSGSLPPPPPDILIASGGKSIFFARYLADKFGSHLIFCGSPAPYPAVWFDCILSTEFAPDQNEFRNWIHTDVLMNSITPDLVDNAAVESPLKNSNKKTADCRVGTVLVGGYSRSHLYVDEDWISLGMQLNALSERDGWRWLIATSRRTGSTAESALESVLESKYVLDAVWWSKKPRKTIRAYLGHAQMVFVGRDSMTMVSEAVCSGRPVIVYAPKQTTPSLLIDGFIENLENNKLILNTTCQNILDVIAFDKYLMPISKSPVQNYACRAYDIVKSNDLKM